MLACSGDVRSWHLLSWYLALSVMFHSFLFHFTSPLLVISLHPIRDFSLHSYLPHYYLFNSFHPSSSSSHSFHSIKFFHLTPTSSSRIFSATSCLTASKSFFSPPLPSYSFHLKSSTLPRSSIIHIKHIRKTPC